MEIPRGYMTKARSQLLQDLGGVCIKCGFSDKRALQIDHINGGGTEEVKIMGSYRMIYYYLENPEIAKKKVQVLCANCNWIKRSENKENRGIRKIDPLHLTPRTREIEKGKREYRFMTYTERMEKMMHE